MMRGMLGLFLSVLGKWLVWISQAAGFWREEGYAACSKQLCTAGPDAHTAQTLDIKTLDIVETALRESRSNFKDFCKVATLQGIRNWVWNINEVCFILITQTTA